METWEKRLVKSGFDKLIEPAVKKLKESSLTYHNFDYIEDRLNFIGDVCRHATTDVILAMLYKDTEYGSISVSKRVAERSAAFLLEQAELVDIPLSKVQLVCKLIENSHDDWKVVRYRVDYEPLAILLDADIYHYGLKFDDFLKKENVFLEEQIKRPNNYLTLDKARVKHAKWLTALLSMRETVYHSEGMINTLERQARSNILDFLELHRSKA